MIASSQLRRLPLDRQSAETLLQPFLAAFVRSFEEAWAWSSDLLDEDPDRRATLDGSTRAALVYDRFKHNIRAELHGRDGVRFVEEGRMLRVRINDQIVLRFKRFDRSLCSRNVRTRSQRGIYHQFDLFDATDGATSLTFGYQLDRTGRRVRGLYITCPRSWSRNYWMIVLADETAGELPLLAPASNQPAPQLPSIRPAAGAGEQVG